MTAKKRPAKKSAPRRPRPPAAPVHELDDLNSSGHPGDGFADEDSMTLKMTPEGVAFFWPASFDKLDSGRQELARQLMLLVGQRRALGREIDALVEHMRSHGVSWLVIGWCVGTSAEAARQRWGVRNAQG